MAVAGGDYTNLELVKRSGNSAGYQIVLVDPNDYNFFPLLFHPVSTRFKEPSALSYPFRKTLRKLKNVRLQPGSLEKAITEENKIRTPYN